MENLTSFQLPQPRIDSQTFTCRALATNLGNRGQYVSIVSATEMNKQRLEINICHISSISPFLKSGDADHLVVEMNI